jgi:DNA (cytosine-5)-methyltransferase 1
MNFSGNVISLFSGAGGLDLGFEAAGFVSRVCVEMDKHSCVSLRHNRPEMAVVEAPIAEVQSSTILESANLSVRQCDVLIGGPPCQPFSKSSYWSKGDSARLDDPRADTLTQYMRVLEDTLPKAFLIENVSGLVYKGKDEGFRHIEQCLAKINQKQKVNYSLCWKVLNAAEYGVPQLRERTFLVGFRDGTPFRFPSPKFAPPELANNDLFREPFRTAWDAIGDLPHDGPTDEKLHMTGKWADLLPSIPEGENYLWHTDRKGGVPLFGWRRRYWSFLLKLAKTLPSWTIQAQPGSAIGPFHWASRRLSRLEMQRIQTFPDDYEVLGSRVEIQRQIGNAVPSLMAEVLGLAIREQLTGVSTEEAPLKLLPPKRSPVPKPERIAAVDQKYLHLEGEHAEHPGTGKGPRAVASS